MRRSLIAATAAAWLLSAMAGPALAIPMVPGTIDWGVSESGPGFYQIPGSTTVTQSITPLHSGLLTHLQMWCQVEDGGDVTLAVGSATAVGHCTDGAWDTDFIFPNPPTVVAGTPYVLRIDTTGLFAAFNYSTDPQTRVALSDGGNPITVGEGSTTITSFAFLSYVLQPPTTTYAWNPASVLAGQSTTATLTATTVFPPSYAQPDAIKGAKPNTEGVMTLPFTLKLAALPAWFTPTGIQCDAAVTNCTMENFGTGLTGNTDAIDGATVIVTVTGIAAPPSNATSTSGQASGQGCTTWTIESDTIASCGTGQSVLGLVGQPTPHVTLAPTTTSEGGSDGGPSPWLLLWTLPALIAASGVVIRRHEARDRA